MEHMTKKEAEIKIRKFFEKNSIEAKEVKKIKKLTMRHRIRLKDDRKRFCKKCYSDLRNGKIRINKKYKQVICKKCNTLNRWTFKD